MADIARLAGEKRATVGNWKARNPEDFPRESGRGPRGPLYDRAEVVAWLEARNRLHVRAPEVEALWSLASSFRGELSTYEVMPLLFMLLAIKSTSPNAWDQLRNESGSALDESMRKSAHELFPFAEDVLPHRPLGHKALADAVNLLSTFGPSQTTELTDALLERAMNMDPRGGEFLTPQSIRQLMISLSEPRGTIYNPATGVAQLMIEAAEDGSERPGPLVGQEIEARIWAMAQLNLAIHDVEATVALGDVFTADQFPDLRADRVLCVPPWSRKLSAAEVLRDDPRWVYGEPGPSDGVIAWIQHCLAHLAENGRAVMVVPNSALFEMGRAGRIRQRIVKAGLLDAVVALPGGLFAWTPLPCAVLVFTRGRRSVDGKPAPSLMIDLTELYETQARISTLSTAVIEDAARMYKRWTEGHAPENDHAALATFEDLAANEFIIDPSRYLSLPGPVRDLAAVSQARDDLVGRLDKLTREAEEADAQLRSVLGGGR
jgi:type I restriction enzyme M protein